ncbi:penicillin-binding transpeptidase domain-containing protein [Bacillus sp. 31A1R]|uniref:serine-type D-Ala-D-Ala carboxypeptidase n=1 Tax=Robertmurraya mangrovi TaxID=3098077 RepID=A0ABU5IXM5_9BACI|nr:penicillin-binding transpeptidase domain-containing protein [Bacillus sp. 31A1R]MDZ5471871.1 penicillin-binding transpeptidase domain-containing protein [Bacillus sp. 31A1R]
MKKFLFCAVLILSIAIMTGCNKEPKPDDRFSEYIELWNEQQFEKMYEYLTTKAKTNISKEDFVKRYKKIYSDLQISDLTIKKAKVKEETEKKDENVQLSFSAKMNSIGGKIQFQHHANLIKEERNEEENWYIDWNTTLIFPELEDGDKIGLSTTPARRGNILDKNGTGLAINGTAYEIGVVPKEMEGQEEQVISQLAELLDIPAEKIKNALHASWVKPEHFVPIKKISKDDEELKEKLFQIPAVLKRDVSAREYPLGEAAAHLIGYVGPITAEELEKRKDKGYQANDIIGKRGLEQVFDEKLKGVSGAKIYIKKTDGSEVLIAQKEVQNGEDVALTIDAGLQVKTYKELVGEAGTSVAIHPETGETLALVSSPSFNPNALTLGATSNQWKALQEDNLSPLLTRFKNTYIPGSVVKPMVAAIALEAGTTDWEKTINISGRSWQKNGSWGKYSVTRVTDPGGPVNLDKALLYSDNIYFAQAALGMGKEKFIAGLEKFSFEEKMEYSYPLETSTYGKMESEVALADSGYGQAQIEMNVVHLAATYTPFVNSGNMIKPILLASEEKGQVWKEKLISAENVQKMNAALKKVVEDPSGTAYFGKLEGFSFVGKTGTAEYKEKQGENGKENGWFVAYNDHLLITLMIEDVENRGGSKIAVQKVRNILR